MCSLPLPLSLSHVFAFACCSILSDSASICPCVSLSLSLCCSGPGLWGSSNRVGGGETEALCWRVRGRRQAVLTPCPCMAVLSGNTQTEKRRRVRDKPEGEETGCSEEKKGRKEKSRRTWKDGKWRGRIEAERRRRTDGREIVEKSLKLPVVLSLLSLVPPEHL